MTLILLKVNKPLIFSESKSVSRQSLIASGNYYKIRLPTLNDIEPILLRIKNISLFLTKTVKSYLIKMDNLGDIIRKLREEKKLPLRTVAAYLDIDQAILSKIERGQRKISRDQVVKLATYFEAKEDDLLVAWLSDKLVYELADEDLALKALQVAEEKIKYITSKPKK